MLVRNEKLDYSYWKTLMSINVKAHNIWSLVELGIQEGVDVIAQKRDQLSLSQIC